MCSRPDFLTPLFQNILALAVQVLGCRTRAFSSWGERRLLELTSAAASLAAGRWLQGWKAP